MRIVVEPTNEESIAASHTARELRNSARHSTRTATTEIPAESER